MLIPRRWELVSATLVLLFASVLAFAPDVYPVMLTRALMPLWALGLCALSVHAWWKRASWLASAMLLGSLMATGQWLLPSIGVAGPVEGVRLRMAHLNVWQPNESYEAVIRSINQSGADLVSVQEVNHAWAEALRTGLSDSYPYQVILPGTNCYGIALLSRVPLVSSHVIHPAGGAFIEADIMVDGRCLRVIAAHAASPTGIVDFRRRNQQLSFLAERIREIGDPVLLIGDLNTVHWDEAYGSLCTRSGLRPLSHPVQLTWPAVGPMAFMPLDHALVKGMGMGGSLRSFRIEGSDHRGLLVEIQMRHAS